jgi:hypothetical protein
MNQPGDHNPAIGFGNRKPTHVVICGYSRSGTTLFYNMLRTTVRNFQFLDSERRAASVIGQTPESYVTKRPLDIFDIDNIVRSNRHGKGLKFIVMIRDIRAVVTSRHKSVPNDYFVGYDHQYFVNGAVATFTNPGILSVHRAISILLARTDPAPIVLKYEDLLTQTDEVQHDLGRRIGFEYGGSFRRFFEHEIPEPLERTLNGKRPLDLKGIDAWRAPRHRERIRQQFTACPTLFSILRAYGYEQDDRWFDAYRAEPPADRSAADENPQPR